jgi:hypothetical protein
MEDSFEITLKKTDVKVLIGFILLKKEERGQGDETSGSVRRMVIFLNL